MSTSLFLHIDEEVTSGTVKVSLNFGSVPVVDETLDLCDLVTQIDKKCPLQKGPFDLKITETIPDYVPSVSNLFIVKSREVLTFKHIHMYMYIQGDYDGKATLTDQDGKELACLTIKLTI